MSERPASILNNSAAESLSGQYWECPHCGWRVLPVAYLNVLFEAECPRCGTLYGRFHLRKLPLAGLEHLGMFATQLDRAARTEGYQLNFAVMFTSFPQVAQALRAGQLAGFLPTLAESELTRHGLKMVSLPFLKTLSISIALIWNARLAPFRPYIAKTSTDLISILKFECKAIEVKAVGKVKRR